MNRDHVVLCRTPRQICVTVFHVIEWTKNQSARPLAIIWFASSRVHIGEY